MAEMGQETPEGLSQKGGGKRRWTIMGEEVDEEVRKP